MISLDDVASEQGLDREDVIELLEDFLNYTESDDLVGMRAALARGESAAVKAHAHSIKGAALNLKLSDIADCAKKIEAACGSNSLNGVADLVHVLEAHMKALPAELDKARQG